MQTLQKQRLTGIGLALPVLIVLVVVFGIPLVQLFLTSLNAPMFSVSNYLRFLQDPANVRVVLQTVQISVIATAACLIVGYPTAYLIVAAPKRLRIVLIVLVMIPYLTSGLARTYAWIMILGDSGLINNLLLQFGIISSPLLLIYNRMALYVGMVHIMLPMMVLSLVSVMLGIDKSLMAAARSMGAPPFTAFCRVFFPLSIPGVRSATLLVFVICLGFYIIPASLGGLGDVMLSNFLASQVTTTFDLVSVATGSFVLLAIAIVVLSILGLDLSGTQGLAAQVPRRSRFARPSLIGWLTRSLTEFSTGFRAKRWTAHRYRPRGEGWLPEIGGKVLVLLVLTYLLAPSVVVIVMSFSSGSYIEFPPSGLSLRWYRSFFGNTAWYGAAWTSMEIGLAVALLSTIVGTLAAYGLSRTSPRLRSTLNVVILTPITIPVIVVGVACYFGLANLGLIGSRTGVILAQSIGAISYVVVIVSATLANFDRRLEQAAQSMRAGPLQTFARVTLPLIRPGIIGGAFLAFIHSFDEVVITSLVSGFSVTTLPLKMWENIRNAIDPTLAAVASLLTVLPMLWLIGMCVVWQRSESKAQFPIPSAAN
ncbi:MAG: ABC transporter permease subunit [Mesorhizobium sp.]|uniref:ABC transporter permease subunit n=1 Tax=Mesorhizobium sp. TaxID=1871066 RepID=UPI000FE845B4|nr:ABC transporter permease subunit [Mesorhizobium sp.]RWH31397.1 MAG: ABC transporter permease subunit [Mesorhizobium sp.]RWH38639.1 MAG: ABC transporter permease subunit [Mesorhizobium sp.]TIO05222.1 MAG: ABC transporter permease subunit [Mesorhizobium sp.]TIR61879.1 MAG: ABC transporter permease subunit [Mesorhizobium sp.]TIR71616.1 MAG: ABC transporter permease subunit [Mesorhizobium sp.]